MAREDCEIKQIAGELKREQASSLAHIDNGRCAIGLSHSSNSFYRNDRAAYVAGVSHHNEPWRLGSKGFLDFLISGHKRFGIEGQHFNLYASRFGQME